MTYLPIYARTTVVLYNNLKGLVKPAISTIERMENIVMRDINICIDRVIIKANGKQRGIDFIKSSEIPRTQFLQGFSCLEKKKKE
jgi:hypothetical protein